ncbi:nucleoside-diphosphate kinase [Actinomadura sp. DC4]|uniref:nucleoside-diphosphate kinase n=1 Tax=Actinomadura sp. DC4 TaxID=3055069 RepID=UPI0025AF7B35|nr:nucleoside-diphosphate kinase [Actinomadura sp. DC4]MDN3358621.1 nucleoside-diphosphate kinase [Actinomadura sp. DC4]
MTGPVPAFLSSLPDKLALYETDAYFLDGFEDLTTAAGDSAWELCHAHALLLLKPDAVVTRRLAPALRWVLANGFSITGATIVTMDRHSVRALWHYGLGAASRDRRDAADLYMTATDCLLVVLARHSPGEAATVTFNRVKGPADPADCRQGQLRHDLGGFNYQLNLVHAADEPADLVRELAVLCDHDTRMALYRDALAGRDATASAHALAARLEAAAPPADLDLDRTLADLARAPAGGPRSSAAAMRSLLSRIRSGRSRDWRSLLGLADDCGIAVSRWQRIVLATYLLDPYLPGVSSLLPDASASG